MEESAVMCKRFERLIHEDHETYDCLSSVGKVVPRTIKINYDKVCGKISKISSVVATRSLEGKANFSFIPQIQSLHGVNAARVAARAVRT